VVHTRQFRRSSIGAAAAVVTLASASSVSCSDRPAEPGGQRSGDRGRPARNEGLDRAKAPPSPTRASGAAPQAVAQARSAARAFLAGYLAFVHGGGSSWSIQHASPQLLRELRRQPPRVTPAQEAARTRVRRLTIKANTSLTARVTATLSDRGGPTYRLVLYIERRSSVWQVTRIGDA
jgi:hypothetical protein